VDGFVIRQFQLSTVGAFLFCYFIFIPAFGQLNTLEFEDFDELRRFFNYSQDRIPLISAHRGGFYPEYPENAIETFEYTISQIFAVIECDVRETKDGVLIMMHDQQLDRTTNCSGKVDDVSFEEIKGCLLKDKSGAITAFNIPTMEQVLKWADRKTVLMLDVKRGVDFENVLREIKDSKAEDRVVIITYTPEAAKKVYSLHPKVLISTTIRNLEELERLRKYGIPEENLLAFVGTKEPSQVLYKALHNAGIYTTLGTMGNLDRKAAAAGDLPAVPRQT